MSAWEELGLATGLRHLPGGLFRSLRVGLEVDRHPGALGPQPDGQAPSDALAGARDQGHFTGKSATHGIPP